MAIGGVVINFAAKTAEAVSDIGKLNRKLDDTEKAGKKAGGKGGLGGLVSGLGAALPVVGAAVAGLVGAGVAMVDMGKAAFEDAQQARKLEDTLRRIPGVTDKMITANEDWITSMELASLVTDTQLRAAISKLTLETGDLAEAQKLAALAADASVATGKSYEAVVTAMAKAADGNTAALKRLYPWLDAGADGTLTMAEAMEQLDDKTGGAAKAAADNDPFRRLGVMFDQLKEAVGGALVPLIDKFGKWMKDPANQTKIKNFTTEVGRLATAFGEDLVEALEDAIAWLKKPSNQAKLKEWGEIAKQLAIDIGKITKAIIVMIDWMNRIPGPGKIVRWVQGIMGGGRPAGGGDFRAAPTAAPTATTAAAAPAPAQPTVIVTEEQVYRAVQRLLMRGQARNGRLVMVG